MLNSVFCRVGTSFCLFLISASFLAKGQEPVSAAAVDVDTPAMMDGRKLGVTTVQFMQEQLVRYDKPEFPGVHTWLAEDGKMLGNLKRNKPDSTWRNLNPDTLVTRNAAFWQMYYEVAPADPGLAMLHAGALLAAGDADRAQAILRLTFHRADLEKPVGDIFLPIMRRCVEFQQASNDLVNEGTALHDKADFAGALVKYDAALSLWPRNGWASYERGLTIMARDKTLESDLVKEAFARCRRLQPFQWAAWQGREAEVPGMEKMQTVVRPYWDQSLQDINHFMPASDLLKLSEALQEAEVDDLALVVRQIYIFHQHGYSPDDLRFIATSLRRLAPGVRTEQTLERMSKKGVPLAILADESAPIPKK